MSFAFDAKCFFKTIVYVLKRSGFVEGASVSHKKKRVEADEKIEQQAE